MGDMSQLISQPVSPCFGRTGNPTQYYMPVVLAPDELDLREDAPARDVDEPLGGLERGEEVFPGGGRRVGRAIWVGQAVKLE